MTLQPDTIAVYTNPIETEIILRFKSKRGRGRRRRGDTNGTGLIAGNNDESCQNLGISLNF